MAKAQSVIQGDGDSPPRNTAKTLVSLRLPDALLAHITAYAARREISRTEAVVELLEKGFHPAMMVAPVGFDPRPGALNKVDDLRSSGALVFAIDALTGQPISQRAPYRKGAKR